MKPNRTLISIKWIHIVVKHFLFSSSVYHSVHLKCIHCKQPIPLQPISWTCFELRWPARVINCTWSGEVAGHLASLCWLKSSYFCILFTHNLETPEMLALTELNRLRKDLFCCCLILPKHSFRTEHVVCIFFILFDEVDIS